MKLPYLDETITSPDGFACRVLDVAKLDFSAAVTGRKSAETLLRCAEGGERIETRVDGKIESVYLAQPGDAIFANVEHRDDIYIPGEPDGTRWKFKDVRSKGYEITGEDPKGGGLLIKDTKTAKLLHEAVQEPSCIKNAWGEGQHVFLHEGATLKLDPATGRVTGIGKQAFDTTWEVLPAASATAPVRAAPVRRP